MASAVKSGLAGIRKHQEEVKAREEARNRPKAEYLSSIFPKKTGDSVVGRFVQELDESGANYDPERGLGLIAVEHEAPGRDGFKRRALCTIEDGDCYPDERKKVDYRKDDPNGNWKTKTNLYINFAVEVEEDGKKVVKAFVLGRNANSAFANQLIEEAVDEGTITDKMYRITKTGEGTQTQWLLKALPKEPLIDDSQVEVYDINETVLRAIPYEEQAEYYGAVWSGRGDEAPAASASSAKAATASDEEW